LNVEFGKTEKDHENLLFITSLGRARMASRVVDIFRRQSVPGKTKMGLVTPHSTAPTLHHTGLGVSPPSNCHLTVWDTQGGRQLLARA
jgi:hypothetical protein